MRHWACALTATGILKVLSTYHEFPAVRMSPIQPQSSKIFKVIHCDHREGFKHEMSDISKLSVSLSEIVHYRTEGWFQTQGQCSRVSWLLYFFRKTLQKHLLLAQCNAQSGAKKMIHYKPVCSKLKVQIQQIYPSIMKIYFHMKNMNKLTWIYHNDS